MGVENFQSNLFISCDRELHSKPLKKWMSIPQIPKNEIVRFSIFPTNKTIGLRPYGHKCRLAKKKKIRVERVDKPHPVIYEKCDQKTFKRGYGLTNSQCYYFANEEQCFKIIVGEPPPTTSEPPTTESSTTTMTTTKSSIFDIHPDFQAENKRLCKK
ncbi:hypothetical protein SNEBB_000272 [Seison nebaliae]|nr:hypothetical protein SNEBB_000272 [Seison nebaliae]